MDQVLSQQQQKKISKQNRILIRLRRWQLILKSSQKKDSSEHWNHVLSKNSSSSYTESWPLYTGTTLNLRQVLGRSNGNSTICQAKEGTAVSCPQDCVFHPGQGSKESYSTSSRSRMWSVCEIFFWLVGW